MPWCRVTKSNPCPVCEKHDWCGITEDGQIVRCMRVESGVAHGEGGWIHRVGTDTITHTRARRAAVLPTARVEFARLVVEYKSRLTVRIMDRVAGELGLPGDALRRMEIGWDGKNFTFPMLDGKCEYIGIRLRSQDGSKFAVRGSRNGLFIPDDGVYPDSPDVLYIVEGPTDCAAMVAMGLAAIGLPMSGGGIKYLKEFIGGHRRQVVIVADHDEAKDRPDGTQWHPGIEGAERAAAAIRGVCAGVKVVVPPNWKDAREMYCAGAGADVIRALEANVAWQS